VSGLGGMAGDRCAMPPDPMILILLMCIFLTRDRRDPVTALNLQTMLFISLVKSK